MNSTFLTPTADPFARTLSDLSTTLTDFAPLVTPIDAIDTLLTDIDTLLKDFGELITAFEGVDAVIELLGSALEFLSPIPIVGEIADVIAGLIDAGAEALADVLTLAQDLNTEVIKPVLEVLEEIVTGLGDARAVTVEISQKVPGYINTIEILHYLSEIASPIVEVLKGTKPADDLAAVLDTFNTVQEDVGKALLVFDPAIRAVGTGVKDLTKVFQDIMHAMGQAGRDALTGIEDAAHALQPISDGFNRLVDAIKPLKWVLDALKCVFDKILKPVIDAILKATGLDALVHKAEDAIFAKLGIKPVLDLAQGHLGNDTIQSTSDSLGPDKGAGTGPLWDATQTALGQYRSGDSSATKTALLTVISAVAQTPLDPNKPAKAPPFPPTPPDLTKPVSGTKGLAAGLAYTPRRIRRMDPSPLARLQAKRCRPAARSMLVAMPEITDDLPKIDPKLWPQSAALVSEIDTLVTALDTLSPQAVSLESALAQMDAALKLPATFDHQVADMSALLGDAVHILTVLEGFNISFVNSVVAPFVDVAKDQNTKMGAVTTALPKLTKAVGDLDAATGAVISAFPDATLIEDTLRRVEGWRLSLGQTIALVRAARIKDANQGNTAKDQIDTLAAQIEASAADLRTRLTAITGHITAISGSVTAVQGGIGTYTTVLADITQHSTLLSDKALPVADQAVHVLGVVNSIVDPLSGLIELLDNQPAPQALGASATCPDADSAMKTFGIDAAKVITAMAQSDTNTPKSFESFAEGLAEQALPLTAMATSVSQAATTLSTDAVSTFQTNAAALKTSLAGLTTELSETKTYSTTITTRTGTREDITVPNDIIDNAMLSQAQAIMNSLGFAAKGH
ncbi:hypothetical protein [Litorisediminicola beolgyonensis]|uniref:Uncharacterized protein n=1 Tax=Litorisediminicola beolgyonensis TaxID=1173614 RepID=A0ABW3ZNP9_9RHOB